MNSTKKTYKLCGTCKHLKRKNEIKFTQFENSSSLFGHKIIFQKVTFHVFNISDRCYLIVLMPNPY